ncbi:MAG: ABC transporter ATP-binding protein [Syntrophales bacterium]|nr:ABC transporter ATP-binding protein [Syntrophales bacterium]MDD5643491.1 ABC transporter ATP-binding protein [Syntrophales bacterium]
MQPAIFAAGIGKSFRTGFFGPRKQVLQEVDLEVGPGSIFGILGPNGAGKTTFISILATLLRPDAGQARVLGLDVVKDADRLRERVNLAASGAHFLWCLTVEENLKFYGRLYGLGGKALATKVGELLDLFELQPHRRVTFERLSTGLKQRLALAKALINTPELLFLDEPTTGLDPEMAQHIRGEIQRLNRDAGLTILLTTHNMREAESLCGEVAFLKEGRLVARGTMPELQERLGLGDRLSLFFKDGPAPLDYGRLPGVLTYKAENNRVDLMVDRAEKRLAAILEEVSQTQSKVIQVQLKEVDLAEIYHEITH